MGTSFARGRPALAMAWLLVKLVKCDTQGHKARRLQHCKAASRRRPLRDLPAFALIALWLDV